MRALFVSPTFPEDFSKAVLGIHQRMRMWLEALQSPDLDLDILFLPSSRVRVGPETAAAVTRDLFECWRIRANVVVCPREPDERRDGIASRAAAYVAATLRPSRHPFFRPYIGRPQREALAQCLAESPEIVFFHRLQSTGPATRFSLRGMRTYLDLDDVEHRAFAREIAQPPWSSPKRRFYFQVATLWWAERTAIARSRYSFVCSEADRRYLQRTMRVRNVVVVPNAVARVDDGLLTTEPNVLFIGTYGYSPNVVAAEYLIQRVWPLLTRLCPNARLLIAGSRPENIPSCANPPAGVEFLGFVPDLSALYRRTRLLCCPIQSGGGTRVKILEAASHGIPVVSTPIGAEGLDFTPDTHIILRGDATGLAEACAALLSKDGPAQRIGISARERVRALYSRDGVVSRMRAILGDELRLAE
jgi:glycosyltransferase involved in cell wall biosynthesis